MVVVSVLVYGLVLIGKMLGERFLPLWSAFVEKMTVGGALAGL
jgi:hypothetical protein